MWISVFEDWVICVLDHLYICSRMTQYLGYDAQTRLRHSIIPIRHRYPQRIIRAGILKFSPNHFYIIGKRNWRGYCLYQNYCTTCCQAKFSAAMIAVFRLPPHPQLNIGNVALQKPGSPTRIIASPSLAQRRPKQCVYIVFNVKFGGWRGLRVNSFAMFAFLRQAKWCNNSGSDR